MVSEVFAHDALEKFATHGVLVVGQFLVVVAIGVTGGFAMITSVFLFALLDSRNELETQRK